MASVAKHIRALRTKKNMTQEELAEKLYVTRQTVSNWETAKSQPDVETLEKIAAALDTDLMELIYGVRPTEGERRLRRKWIRICAALCCALLVLFGGYVLLKNNGALGTWNGGLAYQFWNANYSLAYGEIQGSYAVELDLSDLESNLGKALYAEDGCRIVVDYMDETTPGCYRVFFRAHGKVGRAGSRLVSGVQPDMVDKNTWTIQEGVSMTVTAGERTEACDVAGCTGLLWKDGNQFGFYIDTERRYEDRPALRDAVDAAGGTVTATVSDLTWMEMDRLEYWSFNR